MIVDIHSHIKYMPEQNNYEEEKLLQDMEKNEIVKRVVSTLEGRSTREINDYISDLVTRHPDKLIGCAVINPKEFDAVEETKRAIELPGIAMVEFNSLEHSYYPDVEKNLEEIFAVIEEKQMPVKVFTGIGSRSMPHQWIKHVEKHPRINFIFLHMGCFDYGYGCIDLVTRYANLYVETSNQYEVQILRKAFTTLSSDRIAFGSLFPERLTKCSISLFDRFNLEEGYLKDILSETPLQLLASE